MTKEHIEKCPVCEQTIFSQKFFCEDYFVSHEKFPIYYCNACSFNFTQHIPGKDEINRYYETLDYVSHSNIKKGLINTIYHWVRKRMLWRKAKIVEKNQVSKHLLDVGCGTGHFAGTMQYRGWKTVGIEPAVEPAEFAKKNFNLTVKSSLFADDFTENYFDVITLWHVLEHLPELNKSMEKLHQLLKDDGMLVIAIPNIKSYDAEKYQKYWAAYDVPRHIWHFSPETFRILATNHGFQVFNQKTMPFDAFYISMMSEKYKGTKLFVIKGIIAGIFSYIICLFNKNKSSSLIYLLKKQEKFIPEKTKFLDYGENKE